VLHKQQKVKKTMKEKILVTGSRSFGNITLMQQELQKLGNIHVIHGGATGADATAQAVCEALAIPTTVVQPLRTDINTYFLHRNAEMVGMCDEVLAFWNGKSRGTKFTIDYAKARGLKVNIILFT